MVGLCYVAILLVLGAAVAAAGHESDCVLSTSFNCSSALSVLQEGTSGLLVCMQTSEDMIPLLEVWRQEKTGAWKRQYLNVTFPYCVGMVWVRVTESHVYFLSEASAQLICGGVSGLAVFDVASFSFSEGQSAVPVYKDTNITDGISLAVGSDALVYVGGPSLLRVLRQVGSTLVQVATIVAPLGVERDSFGTEAIVRDDWLVVGGRFSLCCDYGSVYFYRRKSELHWEFVQMFNGTINGQELSIGLAMSKDQSLVIAGSHFQGGLNFFVRAGGQWELSGIMYSPESVAYNHFGHAVALLSDDKRMIVLSKDSLFEYALNGTAHPALPSSWMLEKTVVNSFAFNPWNKFWLQSSGYEFALFSDAIPSPDNVTIYSTDLAVLESFECYGTMSFPSEDVMGCFELATLSFFVSLRDSVTGARRKVYLAFKTQVQPDQGRMAIYGNTLILGFASIYYTTLFRPGFYAFNLSNFIGANELDPVLVNDTNCQSVALDGVGFAYCGEGFRLNENSSFVWIYRTSDWTQLDPIVKPTEAANVTYFGVKVLATPKVLIVQGMRPSCLFFFERIDPSQPWALVNILSLSSDDLSFDVSSRITSPAETLVAVALVNDAVFLVVKNSTSGQWEEQGRIRSPAQTTGFARSVLFADEGNSLFVQSLNSLFHYQLMNGKWELTNSVRDSFDFSSTMGLGYTPSLAGWGGNRFALFKREPEQPVPVVRLYFCGSPSASNGWHMTLLVVGCVVFVVIGVLLAVLLVRYCRRKNGYMSLQDRHTL